MSFSRPADQDKQTDMKKRVRNRVETVVKTCKYHKGLPPATIETFKIKEGTKSQVFCMQLVIICSLVDCCPRPMTR